MTDMTVKTKIMGTFQLLYFQGSIEPFLNWLHIKPKSERSTTTAPTHNTTILEITNKNEKFFYVFLVIENKREKYPPL